MVDVLVPDMRSDGARTVGRVLEEAGHAVHSCARDDGAVGCASLAGHRCPFDSASIDVAVDVANDDALARAYGDGALCALQRHVPLVIDNGDHALAPWAAGRIGADAAGAVERVMGTPLRGHTAAAARALLHELRNHGESSTAASVTVTRRPGALLVELRTSPEISRTQGERLAVRLAQAVRRYDGFAPKLDVSVRTDPALAG